MVNETKTVFPTFYRLPILSARKICHTQFDTECRHADSPADTIWYLHSQSASRILLRKRISAFVEVIFVAEIRLTARVSRYCRRPATSRAISDSHGDRCDRTKTSTSNHKKGTMCPPGRWSVDGRKCCIPRTRRQSGAWRRTISLPDACSYTPD